MARRTFYHFVFIGIVISLPGIFIDVDHGLALVVDNVEPRWSHYLIAENPVAFVLYCVLWSFILLAFTDGLGLTENEV